MNKYHRPEVIQFSKPTHAGETSGVSVLLFWLALVLQEGMSLSHQIKRRRWFDPRSVRMNSGERICHVPGQEHCDETIIRL